MTPSRVALLAVVVIILGVAASLWLKEETNVSTQPPPPSSSSKTEQKAEEPAPATARLKVLRAKIMEKNPRTFELTYTITNAGQATTPGSTRVKIFPFRFATPTNSNTEEPVQEGDYGWDIPMPDVVPQLAPGETVQRKMEFQRNKRFDPAVSLLPRIHFEISGQLRK